MTNQEHKSTQSSWDEQILNQGVHQLGLIYGVQGLEVDIKPGAGWSCTKTEQGITITVDPQQTIEGNTLNDENKSELPTVLPEITAMFITAHELGHANDYLDTSWGKETKSSPTDNFFDCLIDDTVIDKRNRRVPMLDANADAVYSHQLPSDMMNLPRHIQLMYGVRVGTVVNNPGMKLDNEIEKILASLKHCQKDGQFYDITDIITDPRTTLDERRRIAKQFIKPHFDALLEQDEKEQTENQDNESGEGQDGFEDVYAQYEEAVHGHQHGDNYEDKNSEQSIPDLDEEKSANNQNEDLAQQIAEAIQQSIQEELKNTAQAKQQPSNPESDIESQEPHEARLSELAGSVAKEMQLSPGNAESYARSLDKWSSIIKEVAEVFMKLAAPEDILMSPRFSRDPRSEGVRLHPRTIAGVALQLATDQEQAIWQKIVRNAKRQEITFGGLDVHLLVDVSSSMSGPKAQCASDMALCLIEGLQLARYKVSRSAGRNHQPDVRTQIIAFGSGTEVLSPLSYQPTGQQKGKTYTNILNADSSATFVNDALVYVKRAVQAKPKRESIAIIISDGQFFDHNMATQTVAEMPISAYISHLVVGSSAQNFISKNHETIDDPNALPSKLHRVLADYIKGNIL